jgi:hypothetical protein
MIQEALFDAPTKPVYVKSAMLPPEPPKLVVIAESLGKCCKCGRDATRRSPSGNVYCAEHGKCGGKTVRETALGIDVRVCGTSVEDFVFHTRLGIYACPCVGS